jgi:UDP-N-acetylmuramyl pentapeptide phosphotransferase/UDP-N-acetylglucosamine-1-phosphate transferase
LRYAFSTDAPVTSLETAAVAFATAFTLTPVARSFGRRMGLLDQPNERSSHSAPTPRNGGYAIAAGVGTALLASGVLAMPDFRAIALTAVAMALLALADELRPLPVAFRFIAQVMLATLVALTAGLLITGVTVPAVGRIGLDALALPLAVIWLVWVTNAYNFMDGINGIASVEAIICGSAYVVLFVQHNDSNAALVAAAIAGAAAGFLPWNLPSGSIFMGDVGSVTLGFLLAALAVRLGTHGSFVPAVLPLLPFLLDATFTLVVRMAKGERFWAPHRSHFYQRLAMQGSSHVAVTGAWGALALVSAALSVTYQQLSPVSRLGALAGLLAIHAIAAGFIHVRGARRDIRVSSNRQL